MKFYIASPFFNEAQVEIVEQIKALLNETGFEFFSPKDDCLFENGKGMDSSKVFQTNVEQIDLCDGIIVVTDFRDPGTLWEAGYSYGKDNIIYIWVDFVESQNFNLMLAHSATTTVKGFDELETVLKATKELGFVPKKEYNGLLE